MFNISEHGSNTGRCLKTMDREHPEIAPFLSTENFLSCPVVHPIFHFSAEACQNIMTIQRCKSVLNRLDSLIRRNCLYKHTCLILQAGSQTTMRLASKANLRIDWHITIEIPFCLYITQHAECPRELDYEDLDQQEEWLYIFEQVLVPMDKVEHKYIPIIAPHQSSKVVKEALMKSKKKRTKNLEPRSTESSGYGSS